MKLLQHSYIIGLFYLIIGCATAQIDPELTVWGTMEEAREYFERAFKHIILVRIDSEKIETEKSKSPWSCLHYQGTVEKVYKGIWKEKEKVNFAISHDQKITNSIHPKGSLMFICINHYGRKKFALAPGDYLSYTKKMDSLIQKILKN